MFIDMSTTQVIEKVKFYNRISRGSQNIHGFAGILSFFSNEFMTLLPKETCPPSLSLSYAFHHSIHESGLSPNSLYLINC